MCTVVRFLKIQVHVLSRRNSFDGEIGSSEEVCHDRGNCREYVYKGCMRKVCSYSIMEVNRTSLNSLFKCFKVLSVLLIINAIHMFDISSTYYNLV